jgi:hypothetical protein
MKIEIPLHRRSENAKKKTETDLVESIWRSANKSVVWKLGVLSRNLGRFRGFLLVCKGNNNMGWLHTRRSIILSAIWIYFFSLEYLLSLLIDYRHFSQVYRSHLTLSETSIFFRVFEVYRGKQCLQVWPQQRLLCSIYPDPKWLDPIFAIKFHPI